MRLTRLLPLIGELPEIEALRERLNRKGISPVYYGMLAAAKPYLLASLFSQLNRPMLIIASGPQRAGEIYSQLRLWSEEPERIFLLPGPDTLPFERAPRDTVTIRDRIRALAALSSGAEEKAPALIVGSARAILAKTIPPGDFRSHMQSFQPGQRISLNQMLATWYSAGYQPLGVVEMPGTFSRRGGIIDVFPPVEELPVRLELFGDEIETLRRFEPTTQRSEKEIDTFALTPASESLAELGPGAATRFSRLNLATCQPLARDEFQHDQVRLRQREHFPEIGFYIPYLYREPAIFLDYLSTAGLVIIDDWRELELAVEELEEEVLKAQEDLFRRGEIPAGLRGGYFTWDDLRERLEERQVLILNSAPEAILSPPEERTFAPSKLYGGKLRRVVADALEFTRRGARVVIASRQAARLAELLREGWVYATPVEEVKEVPAPGSLTLVQGALSEGWTMRGEEKLYLLTDAELFGWAVPQPRPLPRRPPPRPSILPELAPGDYVAHIEHGLALFQGLVKERTAGIEQEYLLLEYAAGDKLYVPIYQVDRVSRYIGASDTPPRISRLGTADWQQVKSRTRRAVKDIARELLALYAARQMAKGHAFSPDTLWQSELEAAFPYIETPDQLRAIQEVKGDMESPRPMDRLVCGDVGYGKTEVALRAAFKAVMDGKQAAMLVPTTVLAQQHTQTFQRRLAAFPVVVEMASRFRTPQEMKATLKGLREGTIDIAIGTHRLLQADVQFKDLGLLTIDEEQRFGVTHKEHLKQMRKQVGVLTLTATPIPRTLYMALTGVRDMTTIETPPEDRLPIITRVAEYDENLIRQAILRELDRGGQVYFVHNRVRGIRQVAARVARLVPKARIAIAHGQMRTARLEKVMLRFAAGEFDILVCTAIIESGLDIPNVNTLVVNRSDQFGLAQLYQLRGRVGRSNRRAYAYFLYSRYLRLKEASRQRLQTIAQATELGAGFNIAMRDLEIRGAGDILGARQHGHISAVGFDLYTRLLTQAVQELKGETKGKEARQPDRVLRPLRETVQLNLPLNAYLPEEYIGDDTLRLELYRRLADLAEPEEVEEILEELTDRFGSPPRPAENLLYLVRIKVLAQEARLKGVSLAKEAFLLQPQDLAAWRRAKQAGALPQSLRVGRNILRFPRKLGVEWQGELERLLEALVDAVARMREAVPAS